jgi:P27 family predicted phage terminase small subunit
MGRPQLSDHLAILKGVRPTRGAEPTATAPGRPRFPKNLTQEQRKIFKHFCRLLEQRRALTEGDEHLLTVASVLFCRMRKAQAKLEVEGEIRVYDVVTSKGEIVQQEKPNYWLKVAETAERNFLTCLRDLGLTAMNRSKVKVTETAEPVVVDPMEEMFGGGRVAPPAQRYVVPEYDDDNSAAIPASPARPESNPESNPDWTSFDV